MGQAGHRLRLRDATPKDATALGDIFVEAWRREHAGLLPQEVLSARSAAQSAANWSRSLAEIANGERKDQFVLLALRGSRPVGLIVVGEQAAERSDGEGEVVLIQVADAHRGSGVGATLMRAAARRLIERGVGAMIVCVLEANASARRFYERMGGQLLAETREVEESGAWFPARLYRWPDLSHLRTRG
jgi:ribosomal protein S18 acetylase RimI-like enzyme